MIAGRIITGMAQEQMRNVSRALRAAVCVAGALSFVACGNLNPSSAPPVAPTHAVATPDHAVATPTQSAGPLPSLPVEFETPGVAPGTAWTGITWTDGSSVPARSIDKVVRWRNGFVADLVDAGPGNHLYASSDGELWRSVGDQLPEAYWRVVESPAGLLALEFDAAAPPVELESQAIGPKKTPAIHPRAAWASADGVHWRSLGPINGLADASVLGLAGSQTSIVAVTCEAGFGSACLTWTSSDGTSWLRTTLEAGYRPTSLTFGAGHFLVTAAGIWNSPDGKSWSKSITGDWSGLDGKVWSPDPTPDAYFAYMTRIEVGAGGLLAFQPNHAFMFRSPDGIKWQFSVDYPGDEARQKEGNSSGCQGSYAVGDGYRLIAYAEDDSINTSIDGVTWTPMHYLPQPSGLDRWNVSRTSGCKSAPSLKLLPRGVLAGGHDAAAYGASS